MWELMTRNLYFYLTILLIAMVGVCCKLVAYFTYLRLYRESLKATDSKHNVIQKIGTEYEKMCNEQGSVRNEDVLLERYITPLKLGKLSVSGFENGNIIAFVLSILAGLMGATYVYITQQARESVVLLFMAGVVGAALQVLVESGCSVEYLRELILINMKDYLDNHLCFLLQKKQANAACEAAMALMPKRAETKGLKKNLNELAKQKPVDMKTSESTISREKKEQFVEDVLRSFFLS